jgi:hypothetical protein
MAAGVHGRANRSVRDIASLPGWLQLLITLATAALVALVVLVAGIGAQYTPLLVGGTLAALVAGAPRRDED